MKKTKERWNPWKVSAVIILVGALCWLALIMLGCVSLINTGKGDQEYRRAEDRELIQGEGTNKVSEFQLKLSPH